MYEIGAILVSPYNFHSVVQPRRTKLCYSVLYSVVQLRRAYLLYSVHLYSLGGPSCCTVYS